MNETNERNETREQTASSAPSLDLSAAIEGILAHPELISMVASTLGKAPPAPSPPAEPSNEASPLAAIAESAPREPLPTEAISAIAPLLSGLGDIKKGVPSTKKDDPRICLLLALKPYLSASRCEAIDTMIRLSSVSEVLRGLPNGIFSGEKGKGGQ
ncbi:MAG: hypothetical protein IJD64_03590 [Clostridia bacterium]|nr:hypothetical protein [Clostridia bacterium]